MLANIGEELLIVNFKRREENNSLERNNKEKKESKKSNRENKEITKWQKKLINLKNKTQTFHLNLVFLKIDDFFIVDFIFIINTKFFEKQMVIFRLNLRE